MRPDKVIYGPPRRKLSGIPYNQLIVIDFDLNGDGTAVILVGDCIEQRFAQGILCDRKCLFTADALV